MALARPTPEHLAALEKAFVATLAMPLMNSVGQFYHPGKVSNAIGDAKSSAADQKAEHHLMTRNEAFSRLIARIAAAHRREPEFEKHIQELIAKQNLSSYEQTILAIAYLYGYGVPKDEDKAILQVELAAKADEKNGYALAMAASLHSVVGEKHLLLFRSHDHKKALTYVERAIQATPDLGYAYFLRGSFASDSAQKLTCYKKAADLGDYLGLYFYTTSCNDPAEKIKYLESELTISGSLNYALEVLYPDIESRPIAVRWFELAAEHGNLTGAINAASCFLNGKGVPQDGVRAARYYRCALCYPDAKNKLQASEPLQGLFNVNGDNLEIIYHYAMAFNDTNKLNDVLQKNPELFIRLWNQDYNKPLHPQMKAQVVAYASKLEPEKITSAATCRMLATTFSNCAEKSLKDKARAFSLAAVAKGKQEEATKKLAEEKAKNLALPKGVVATYTAAATGGSSSAHSINDRAPDAVVASSTPKK